MDLVPHKALVGWLGSIDEVECVDILFLALQTAPLFLKNFPDEKGLDNKNQMLSDILNWFESSGSYWEALGRLLAVKSMLEHFIMLRSDLARWENVLDLNKKMLAELREAGEVSQRRVEMLENIIAKMPARVEKWKSIGPSWVALIEDHLSDDKLSAWTDAMMIQEHRAH